MLTNCCNPIINQNQSLIASPICTPVCPQDLGCSDIINTTCINYSGPSLNCLNIPSGTNLNTLIGAINTQLCSLTPPSGINCMVYASCTDVCPSPLINKITSSTLNVNLVTSEITGCESVDIEEQPWIFSNLTSGSIPTQIPLGFPPPLATYSPYLQPSTPRFAIRCSTPTTSNNTCTITGNPTWLEVRLQGQFNIYISSSLLVSVATNLFVYSIPSNYAPLTPKFFPIVAYTTTGLLAFGSIVITTAGNIILNITPASDYTGLVFISLDGLNYIKN